MTLQFLGYALPGTVMSLFGVGWCWGHAGPRSRHGRLPAKADLRLRWPRLAWHRHPVQGVLKLLISLVGIVGSLFAAYPDGSFQYVGDVPFATVYLFFTLSGAVDILACYCPQAMGRGHARTALALAFFMEAFLFHHVEVAEEERGLVAADGRYALHLLVGVMGACGVFTMLCGLVPWPCREALDAVRCAAGVVHGTWLYHCGLLLYWPPAPRASTTSGASTLWVTLSFAWHCAAATSLLIVFLVARRSACASRRQRHRDHSPPCSPCPPAALAHPFGLRSHHHGGPVRVLGMAGAVSGSPHHSCVLCSGSPTTASYHRSGSLV